MPLYEYQCRPNNHRFEVRHGINEEPVKTCPECGGEVRRVIHPVGIVFKGSGFYVTDSRGKSSTAAPATSTSDTTSKASEGGESKSADSTPAPKSESAAS